MAKPWARYEVGFINHPKFRALAANAIGLWIEGKNYCDENMTDGLIPTHIAKQFRFFGKKSVDALRASCGPKNEHEAYAPLWEDHLVGYRMHDYLDHNDCRDEVMTRINDAADAAELRKAANRGRQAKFRADRKAKIAALRNADSNADGNATLSVTRNGTVTPLSQGPTETETQPEPSGNTAATPRLLAREPNERGNYHVVAKLAFDLLQQGWWESAGERYVIRSESDLTQALKDECGRLRIARIDADVVHRAAASEWFKHEHPEIVGRPAVTA